MSKPATRTNALNQRIAQARADQATTKYADARRAGIRELAVQLDQRDNTILDLMTQVAAKDKRIAELETLRDELAALNRELEQKNIGALAQ